MADKDEAAAGPSSDADDLSAELAETDDVYAEAQAEDDDRSEPEPAELATAGVGATAIGGTGRAATRKAAPQPKGSPTAKRDVVPTTKRTTPPAFIKQSVGELRKVVYPTGQQLGNYFIVVLVFVLFIIAYVSLLDLGIGKLILALFS